MCGIAGFYQSHMDFNENREHFEGLLHNMKKSIISRGPDDNGIFLSRHCGLAHTRLSIIDLANGIQPMTKCVGGRKCTIVYNGEIYNCDELRELLKGYSLSWKTASDTEVILNGYIALGTEFFKSLNGIFAFGIFDESESGEKFYLVRDHLGVKPLFYQMHENTLVFGSEPKAIFAYGIKPELDDKGWCEIIGLGPARTPGEGVFKDMREVLPGHFIEINGSAASMQDRAFWKLTAKQHTDSYNETLEKVSYLVKDSVRLQMISDVPICTFLSGGLDSSLVSAICSRELKKQNKQLNTFSFDFVGNSVNFKANSFQSTLDRPFVDIMVKHIGSNHTYLECDNISQADYLYKAVDARDLPCMADVESSMLYFCEQVAKQVKVTLTGECADEIFGGYPWFHREEMWNRNNFPWSYDMEARTALFKKDFISGLRLKEYTDDAYSRTIAETPSLKEDSPKEARRREISWLNVRWFMATLLNRMDRTSMYSGLEARVPYADYRILEYVYNIPWDMKCRDGVTKSLLIETGKEFLPDEVLFRKKSPYPKTYDTAYEKLLGERLLKMLEDSSNPLSEIADKSKVKIFLSNPSDYGKPWYGQLMAGPQMLAYLLQIGYWLEKYKLL